MKDHVAEKRKISLRFHTTLGTGVSFNVFPSCQAINYRCVDSARGRGVIVSFGVFFGYYNVSKVASRVKWFIGQLSWLYSDRISYVYRFMYTYAALNRLTLRQYNYPMRSLIVRHFFFFLLWFASLYNLLTQLTFRKVWLGWRWNRSELGFFRLNFSNFEKVSILHSLLILRLFYCIIFMNF